MNLEEINSSAFPEESNSRRFFDDKNWLAIVAECFGLKTRFFRFDLRGKEYFTVVQEGPQGLFSNFIGYGGPFANEPGQYPLYEEFFPRISELIQKPFRRVKLYPFTPFVNEPPRGFREQRTSVLNLSSELVLEKKTRYEVGKAGRQGVAVRKLNAEDIEAFYGIYTKTAERVRSAYVTPKELFSKAVNLENCLFLGAFLEERLVSASVFLNAHDWSYYWWNCTSDIGRESSANYLVMFEAIRLLQANDFSFLDMASSHSKAIQDFKMKWGGLDVPYFEYSN